ncbi:hypothetical protein BH11PAT1_BH11PAT1_3650 [soil metagenome]
MILSIVQIVVAVLLVISILLQAPEGGISPVFGGGGEMYRSKRNVEKFLMFATAILIILLAVISLIQVLPH